MSKIPKQTHIIAPHEILKLKRENKQLFEILQSLVVAHDEQPSMLTSLEWNKARLLIKRLKNKEGY